MIAKEDVIALVAEAFNIDHEGLTLQSHRDDIEEWDSMGMLMLMAELDERFDIVVDEDVLAELETIEDIVKLLETHGKLAA